MDAKRSRELIRRERFIDGRHIPGISLERVDYYVHKGAHPLVVCMGLGSSAKLDPLIEGLAKNFRVTACSPRGAGTSIGSLTLGDHIMDVKYIVDKVGNERGEKPYVYGHSFGAHALAKALTIREIAKKALLAAPLLHPLEQNPSLVNWYLKRTQERQEVGGLFSLAAYASRRRFLPRGNRDATWLVIDNQWFSKDAVLPFLDSLILAEPVTGKLQSPTRVLLAGKSNFGFTLDDFWDIACQWEKHGAQVVSYKKQDHYFSDGKGYFTTPDADAIIGNITDYFNQ